MSRRLGAVVLALSLIVVASCSNGSDGDLPDDDVAFLQAMYDHHEQAVRMALLVVQNDSASPVTQAFATDVIASQRYEMGMMEGYLTAAGEARGDAVAHDMPGMASAEELGALAAATGDGVDALFFDLMVEHHIGGIEMAEDALGVVSAAHVDALAERIITTQRLEITDMGKAKSELGLG